MEELTDMIAPSQNDQDFVLNYLENYGCSGTSFGDFISAEGPAASVEKLFGAEFFAFKHSKFNVVIHRSIHHPIIPEDLMHIVQFVTGIATFPHERKPVMKTPIDSTVEDVDKWVLPQTLRNLYNIPSGTVNTAKTNSMGVVEFGIVAGISQKDLNEFNQLTDGPSDASLAYTVGTFAFTPISPIDGECTLDVQYIMAVGNGVATSFWTINGWMYDFTTEIQTRQSRGKPVPLVFSMSYGWAEADQCSITGNGTPCSQIGNGSNSAYVEAVNTNFQKLGATGISLLCAAGDAGAASKENLDCNTSPPIQPNFPASSPYITTVGGTMLQNGGTALTGDLPPFCTEPGITCAGGGVEVVSTVPEALITTGGGFSNVFGQPSYQTAAVNAWMSSGALQPPAQYFNASGRAYPDVAGLAHKYMIVENGEKFSVDGTSASCPVTAGIIALVNGNRLNNGQSSLGFLNPSFYNMAQSNFNDITVGNNTGTEANGPGGKDYCFTYGYGASAGWDPCTGFGTPNYQAWNTYFKTN
eukprot:CAMPEP_0117035624 /NCGR_PEP_ID=MMETSP0472-20121206/25288_1 /TAXON_ID=693140 ORGANISM="Tiarina fusus, Strain LIS" /NCGR_SAMPLE_ID=MMETSP0472 /ASSEMBLY_ACC=CAM_ASM_000603 /LENGTH=526 /DNA_ID=CAMNT_0004745147 /DNA_START=206 /DNA_END=1786 /DNA_ORIENTATION=+